MVQSCQIINQTPQIGDVQLPEKMSRLPVNGPGIKPFLGPMAKEGQDIPDSKEDAGRKQALKPGADQQAPPPELPADIDHGSQEGNMPHLMRIETLRVAVSLDGQGRQRP